jgi:hypothetical protein
VFVSYFNSSILLFFRSQELPVPGRRAAAANFVAPRRNIFRVNGRSTPPEFSGGVENNANLVEQFPKISNVTFVSFFSPRWDS